MGWAGRVWPPGRSLPRSAVVISQTVSFFFPQSFTYLSKILRSARRSCASPQLFNTVSFWLDGWGRAWNFPSVRYVSLLLRKCLFSWDRGLTAVDSDTVTFVYLCFSSLTLTLRHLLLKTKLRSRFLRLENTFINKAVTSGGKTSQIPYNKKQE